MPWSWNKFLILTMMGAGVFVVGSGLAVLWYRVTAKGALEQDTIWFLVKMFAVIAFFFPLLYLILGLLGVI